MGFKKREVKVMRKIISSIIFVYFFLVFTEISYGASIDDVISLANQKRMANKLDEALKLYSDILPESKELSPYVRFYMGLIHMYKEEYSEAFVRFNELWEKKEGLPLELKAILPYRIAQLYEKMGSLTKAYDFYLIVLTSGTDYLKKLACGRLASIAYSMGKYEKALEWLLKVLEKDPNDEWANDMLLKLYRKVKKPSSELLYRVGMAYYYRNNYKTALYYFRKSGRKFWEGLTLERLNLKREAFNAYTTLLKRGVVSEALLRRFVNLAESLNKKGEGIALLYNLLRKDSKNKPLIVYYLYYLTGDPKFKNLLKSKFPASDWALEMAWFDGWEKYVSRKYKDAMKEWTLVFNHHKGSLTYAKVIYYLSKVGLYSRDKAKAELLASFPTEYYTVRRYGLSSNEKMPPLPKDRLLMRLYKTGFWEIAFLRVNLLENLKISSRNYFLSLVSEKLSNYSSSIAYAYFLINSGFRSITIWRKAYPLGDHYDYILRVAKREKVDPLLVLAVIHQESRFDPQAVSWAGAIGLMQLMPFTGKAYGVRERGTLFVPEVNIRVGIKHLKELLDRYRGNLYLALAAYNAGSGNVDRWLKSIKAKDWEEWAESLPFRETRNYVRKVMAAYRVYKELYRRKSGSNS